MYERYHGSVELSRTEGLNDIQPLLRNDKQTTASFSRRLAVDRVGVNGQGVSLSSKGRDRALGGSVDPGYIVGRYGTTGCHKRVISRHSGCP
jgi:hypothetical protein